jgi:hypothetical protein
MAEAVVADPSPLRPGFDPSSVLVGFVVKKVALEQISFLVLMSSYVSVILSMVDSYSFTYHKGYRILVARGGQPTTDTTKLKGIAATIGQHNVGFQVYCNLNHYSIHTVTRKVNI